MKRIVTLLLAAGLVLGAAAGSQAADIKAKGSWQFGFEAANTDFDKHDTNDRFIARQRFRTQVDFIASESLKGVMFFEIGTTDWGNGGGQIGTDGKDVKVRYSYVDWVIPNTEVKVRMGLQPYSLPGFVASSPILQSVDGAGITISGQFTENVGATAFWMRADNGSISKKQDIADIFGLTVPLTFDGVKVTPWAAAAFVGKETFKGFGIKDSGSTLTANGNDHMLSGLTPAIPNVKVGTSTVSPFSVIPTPDNGNAYWLGVTGQITTFDPFRFAFDGAYGHADFGSYSVDGASYDVKRAGWYLSALAEYKLDMLTPGLMFWYASGDDSNPLDGSERIPVIDAGWNATPFGYDGSVYGSSKNCQLSDTIAGTWGVQARLTNISFMEDLTHAFYVSYITGTNDKNMAKYVGTANSNGTIASSPLANRLVEGVYLTEKDHAFEIDFTTNYNIYKDLKLTVELGYINLDLDSNVWVNNNIEKNAYKAGAYLTYSF